MCRDCIEAARLTWDVADILDRLADDCKGPCERLKNEYRHKAEELRDLGCILDEEAGLVDPRSLEVR